MIAHPLRRFAPRVILIAALGLILAAHAAAQCEGDLSWDFDDHTDEGLSIGKLFSNAVTPQIVSDTKIIRRYVRDPRFAELKKRCGDIRAIDAIYERALKVAEYNIGRGLLISMMAVLEHQNIQVRLPLVQSLTLPLSFEEDTLFQQRVRNLPSHIYPDSPTSGIGDRDKLQHFFASAYLAYASESSDIARGAGNAVEWGEAQFVVGGADDPRDKMANAEGGMFGRDLLFVKNLLPSDYLRLAAQSTE